MKKAERLVFYYDLSIRADSRTFSAPKPISVKKAFQLMELVPVEQRLKEMSKGREKLYISDWDWKGDIITILVNKSDKSMSDPVFTIPEEKSRRTARKTEKEGQDFSVHIVIQLPKDELEPALVLVENCAGLGVTIVQKLFNEVLKDAKSLSTGDFEQIHPDGSLDSKDQPKKYNVNFKCEFQGHLSSDLIDDLNHGKIQHIELITEKEKHTNIDEDGYLFEKCKTLVLTLEEEKKTIKNKFGVITKLLTNKKEDYSRARIKFKTHTGVERSVEFDTQNARAEGYVKREKLDGFDFDLKSSYDKFCDAILVKMKDLLQPE